MTFSSVKNWTTLLGAIFFFTVCLQYEGPRLFMLSNVTSAEKERVTRAIKKLNGEIIENAHFDPRCTHMIASTPGPPPSILLSCFFQCMQNDPARREKFLAALLRGSWLLHPAYIDASAKKGEWLREDYYEWGTPIVQKYTPKLTEDEKVATPFGRTFRSHPNRNR